MFVRRALATASRAVATNNVAFMSTGRRSTTLQHAAVLMASGPDDKDVLSIITKEIAKLNGNIEESRMTGLGGDFSLVSLVSIPMTITPDVLSKTITDALPDFSVSARITSATPSSANVEPSKVLALDVEGPDQPKIVSTFAEILFKHGVSVKDVITDTSSAPFLGYNIFAMKVVVAVPVKADMASLEKELQAFEESFGLSLTVSDPADQGHQQGEEQA